MGAEGGPSSAEVLAGLRQAALAHGLRFVDEVPDEWLDASLVSAISVEWARSNAMLPVRLGEGIGVLTCDPDVVGQQESLALVLDTELVPVVAPREEILRCIERCYYRREGRAAALIDELDEPAGRGDAARAGGGGRREVNDLLAGTEGAPVAQLVNLIVLDAVKRGASDVHFEPGADRLRLRYRVDGVLYEQRSPPVHLAESLVSRIKVMAHLDIAERRLPQDGMLQVSVGERAVDVRVSTIPVADGERVVLRLLDRERALLPLADLGFSEADLTVFRRLLAESNGMVVVSGPTGSGKTTTLYGALQELDACRRNILTIEDPVEYRLPDIGQIQVRPKIGLTFSNGLRHILRQDPDIVLVGETRDLETADIAIRASLTGHLVLTTLHTNDAPGAVVRLVDMGVAPYLLAACLRGVVAQRLVRRLCPLCRRPESATLGRLESLGLVALAASLSGRQVWEAVGCSACLEGYSGRTGIFEVMRFGEGLRERLRSGDVDLAAVRAAAGADGLRTLASDGVAKVLAGATSLEELQAVVG